MTLTPENKNKRSTDAVASSPARRSPDHPPVTRPSESAQETRSDSKSGAASSMPMPKPTKRKKNRNNRKRRHRRHSFLTAEESESQSQQFKSATAPAAESVAKAQSAANDQSESRARLPFYGLGRDLSDTSLESEALLDHRHQPMMRPRRESRLAQSFKPGSVTAALRPDTARANLSKSSRVDNDSDASDIDDQTPLMRPSSGQTSNVPRYGTDTYSSQLSARKRQPSVQTTSSRTSHRAPRSPTINDRDYDINNPPSMPTSPKTGPEMGYDDAVVTGADFDFLLAKSIDNRVEAGPRDMVIDMDGSHGPPNHSAPSSPPSPRRRPSQDALRRRRTVTLPVEEDVCFPTDVHSEAEDEHRTARNGERRRRRHREWPDLSILEEWMREEKEDRHGDFRSKKISEPMLIEGRLRPQYQAWRREEDDAPYRFTYFNEEYQSTLHAQSISELIQPGGSLRELFIPEPPILEDSSDDEDADSDGGHAHHYYNNNASFNGTNPTFSNPFANHNGGGVENHGNGVASGPNHDSSKQRTSTLGEAVSEARNHSVEPPTVRSQNSSKPKKYGPRPTFWLDVLCPTDAEMRVIAKAFGIHALTAEDIMMQEAREKVELFRNYYFINYRTFEQDPNSETYLEPVNMYVVVFREGVLSFHFSQTPHPANVRRRIRQLVDYLILSSDWISYALIDDITDVFGPLIQAIEDEVDEIDEVIMRMHSETERDASTNKDSLASNTVSNPPAPGEMLRRVGECRKKVMGMYRLLSNKADVVKGFAKRCNEHWEVAPKSEIGLYLGDIQDHIMTMTSSLTYYETLLSRAHSNYLAQINILMNERQERTADVLGKLTVLGTIVLPLNIIGSLWGMNVKVPGQDVENLDWFYSITAALLLFAIAAFYIAKRVYNIV